MTRNLLSFLALNLLFNAINVLSSNITNQCEEGWETLGYEKCYLIQSGSNAKKWGEAKSFCEEQEAELFFPVSGEEEADLWKRTVQYWEFNVKSMLQEYSDDVDKKTLP